MDWFNYYGLAVMAVILIPNIIYAIKHKETAVTYNNKAATVLEQIGRYGCMVLMIFNIPYTYIGFWFSYGLVVYFVVNIALVLTYIVVWVFLWKKSGIVRALLLSILPSIVFIFSSVMLANIPLFVFAVIFAVTHILISVKNAKAEEKTKI